MKLPIEAALLVLSFLRRHALGQVLVANRRLGGIVNRHRKTLNLPEIPVPPRLSTLSKCVAFLAFATLLLLPIGIVFARRSTRSGLRAAGMVPESYRNVRRFLGVHHQPFARTTTSSPTTDASLATRLGWKCSFVYALKEYTVDSGESDVMTFEFHYVLWTNLLLASVASAVAVKVLRIDRKVADQYMAATSGSRRDRALQEHEVLRILVIIASVAGFILAGFYGSVALYGTTFQSFSAVDDFFLALLVASSWINVGFFTFVVMTFCRDF